MVQRWFARSVQARPDTDGLLRSGCAGAIAAWRFVEPPEELPVTIESTPRHMAPRTFPAGHADCLLTRPQGGWKSGAQIKSVKEVRRLRCLQLVGRRRAPCPGLGAPAAAGGDRAGVGATARDEPRLPVQLDPI